MRNLTRILSITVLACSLGITAKAETINPFDDVNSSFWGYSTIEWGIQKNMVSGYPDKTFKPNQSVKESEFLSMFLRYYANNTEQLTFETGGAHWAESYYNRAKEYNLPVSQTASDKPIKRGEVAKLIAAAQGFNYNINNAVQFLYNQGISTGRKGTSKLDDFGKESHLTRTEAVQFIKNLSDKGIVTLKKRSVDPSKPLIEPSTELFPFTAENRLMGYKDSTGRVLVDPQFSGAGEFKEGLALVYFNKKIGFVDSNGELAIPLQFDEARSFSEGLAAVRVGNKYGYIDKTGKMVIPLQFPVQVYSIYSSDFHQYAGDFHNGSAILRLGDYKFGLINKSGKLITTQIFDEIRSFNEGLAVVHTKDGYGYIDTSGKIIVKPQFGIAGDFHEGLAAIGDVNKYGYIDKTGKLAIKPELPFVLDLGFGASHSGGPVPMHDFSEGLAPIRINEKYGFINKAGKIVIQPTIEAYRVSSFSNGMAMVNIGGLDGPFGFIDKTSKMTVPAIYYNAKPFTEDLAAVVVDGKWGYIDKMGAYVIEPQFVEAYPFNKGIAKVGIDGPDGLSTSREYFYIDKKGNRIQNK